MLVAQLSKDLDIGEAEAIALAKELSAHLLIIDEKQGRQMAQAMDLPIIGLLGVLLAGKKAGLIDTLSPLLQRLGDIGFYISNRLMGELLEKLEQHTYQQHAESIYFRKYLRYYTEDRLYLVKPNEKRFWSRSMALNDADEIIAEILTTVNA